MKAGWEETPLGQIAELRGRIGWKGLTAKEYTESGPRFLSVHSLNYGDYVDYRDAFHISQDRYDESPEIMLQRDDLLICKDGAGIGKLGIVPEVTEPTTINSSLLLIRPTAKVFPKYLYFCLLSPYFQQIVQSRLEGATTPHLYQRDITTFPVFLPPINEQKQIVAVLDEAFEGLSRARANAEDNLADARELFVCDLANRFGALAKTFPNRKIGEVAEHGLGKMLDKNKNQGILRPYLRNINVRWFSVETADMLEMKIEDREMKRYSAISGDLLICEGGYPGRAAIWDSNENVFFQKALHRVRFSDPAFGKLLMFFLYFQDATGKLKTHFTGSGIQHFTGQALARFEMPFPDLPTAVETVDAISELQSSALELEGQYAATLAALDTLRQSLLQKAFSGELTR